MRIPIRKTFAGLLFAGAAVPVALVVGHHVAPAAVYQIAAVGSLWATRISGFALGALAVLLVTFPPLLPFLRMRAGAIWRRLGTDLGPLYDGLARLKHLETHQDRLQVGRFARQIGQMPLAVENLGRAYELDPNHVSGRYEFARALLDLEQLAPAAQLLRTVVEADEKHAFGDALLYLGKALYRLHADHEARVVLERHQQLFPGSRQVHLLLARVLADLGELDAARGQLRLAARPKDEGAHLSAEENLARAKARVTILKRGKTHG